MLLAIGGLEWIEPRTAQVLAEVVALVRIGGIVFVVARLRNECPDAGTVIAAVALVSVATVMVVVKVLLTC